MSTKKEENYMASDNFVVIQGWMCNELNLKGNNLLVYALIYGFSRDGRSKYYGGRAYIAKTYNIAVSTVDRALQELVDANLIIKEPCTTQAETDKYYANLEEKQRILKMSAGEKQRILKMMPNNIDTLKKDNICNSTNVELEQPTVAPIQKTPKRRTLVTDTVIPKTVSTQSVSKQEDKPKKKNRYEQCADIIDEYTDDKDLKDVLLAYLAMRLAIKNKPMYVSGWIALMRKLFSLSQNMTELIAIVRTSLENSWATFYPLKNKMYNKPKDVFGERGEVFSIRSKEENISNVQF